MREPGNVCVSLSRLVPQIVYVLAMKMVGNPGQSLLLLPGDEGKQSYLNSQHGYLSATCKLSMLIIKDYFFTVWTTDVREIWRCREIQYILVLQIDSRNQYRGCCPARLTSPPCVFTVNLSDVQPNFEMWPPRLLLRLMRMGLIKTSLHFRALENKDVPEYLALRRCTLKSPYTHPGQRLTK